MNGTMKLMVPVVAALAVAACNGGSSTMPGTAGQPTAQTQNAGAFNHRWGANVRQVCPDATPGTSMCLALQRTDVAPQMHPLSKPIGLSPADIQAAYNLPSASKGSGQVVAIVDAFDNPDIVSDLKTYRAHWGLPAGHFTKYNQSGEIKNYPKGDEGWGVEEDLDVDMVSATCPNCTIILIEANTNANNDLDAAVDEAVKLGAHVVSNSWGGSCTGGCGRSHFDTPGVVYLASSGDGGYGTIAPSQLGSVVSVGGTSLSPNKSAKRGWNEGVWVGAGGGCSPEKKPSWQHDPGCKFRTDTDVSAAADPDAGGAAEYDTYGEGGWILVGGTSESSPLNAGIYGLAGNASKQTAGKAFWTLKPKERKKDLWPITIGSDGLCGGSYLCTAGTHQFHDYSGPAGWGSPNGIGAY